MATPFSPFSLRMHDGRLQTFETPAVMSIVNVTPDSFFPQSRVNDALDISHMAEQHIRNGASIIDIGAYSSRPGAQDVSPQEETERLLRGIRAVRDVSPTIPISVDTFRARVAAEAIDTGADIINDISGGSLDPDMFPLITSRDIPYILMHTRGTPATMQQMTNYENVTAEVLQWLAQRLRQLRLDGASQVIIDPGFGFAKTLQQNYTLLRDLHAFTQTGAPILVGVSRKSMIYRLFDTTPQHALNGTTVINTLALERGASILRVHDPLQASQAVKIVSMTNG